MPELNCGITIIVQLPHFCSATNLWLQYSSMKMIQFTAQMQLLSTNPTSCSHCSLEWMNRNFRTGNQMFCHKSVLLLQQLKHQNVKLWSFWKGWSRRCNDIPLSSEQPSILYIPGIKRQPASTRIPPPPLPVQPLPRDGYFQQAIGWCAGGRGWWRLDGW